MNLECRKEILILRAALEKANRKIVSLEKTKEPFSSDIEPIDASTDDNNTTDEMFMKIAEDIEKEASSTPVSNDGDDMINDDEDDTHIIKLNDPALEQELEDYREALLAMTEDNIRNHSRADSITSSESAPGLQQVQQDLSKSASSDVASERKVNVRMIDGENFSTEWSNNLVELPPPPDHSLHSPIVETILEKWSDDPDTRSSLVGWIENILNGASVDSTPSLKLSGLDHQVRDGVVMHVLPLLLRRKDINVYLTSRAHRQTTYDIAVKVKPNTSFAAQNNESSDAQRPPRDNKHHLIAFKATKSGASINESYDTQTSPNKHMSILTRPFPNLVRTASNAGSISTASAVTSPISNLTPSRKPIYGRSRYTSLSSEMKNVDTSFTQAQDEHTAPSLMSVDGPSLGDALSVASSVEEDDDEYTPDSQQSQKQSSIMGSISGALGLLSRRKQTSSMETDMYKTPKRDATQPVSNDDDQSYHRVVTAPKGKLGIQFVEYRGHAMVSNVSEDSPLAGWVFSSDVLIAIDDIPVSGLRTRDIVKLLTDKANQQRNLRMVSAVALSELTRAV